MQRHYAIPKSGNITVIPYHINLSWIDYLRKNPPNGYCADWLKWYLANLNYPDKYNLTGTIYDYSLDYNGIWSHQEHYDSADSYAASFLILLRDYLLKGGSLELTRNDLARIEDIGWVILILQNPDGTIKARPDSDICYLMNNSEALAGLYAFYDLTEILGLSKSKQFLNAGMNLQTALNIRWKDGKQFYWAISSNESWSSNSENIYPDRLAQLYPIAYGVLHQQPKTRQQLWKQFSLSRKELGSKLSDEQRLVYNWAKEAVQ
ncbi:MAG: hypothetical protein R6V77_01715 [Candidatus Cloacimonadaceae bacterium]